MCGERVQRGASPSLIHFLFPIPLLLLTLVLGLSAYITGIYANQKGAVPIKSMGTALAIIIGSSRRVNRVLEYLVDPALPLCFYRAVVSWTAVGYGAMPCGDVLPARLPTTRANANSGCNDDAAVTGVSQ